MGAGYELHCDNCGYKLEASFGVGMRFSMTYKETLVDARDGKLGDKIQTFLREHPDGAIDCSDILAQCIYCGQYETVQDLTMYLPKKTRPQIFCRGTYADTARLLPRTRTRASIAAAT